MYLFIQLRVKCNIPTHCFSQETNNTLYTDKVNYNRLLNQDTKSSAKITVHSTRSFSNFSMGRSDLIYEYIKAQNLPFILLKRSPEHGGLDTILLLIFQTFYCFISLSVTVVIMLSGYYSPYNVRYIYRRTHCELRFYRSHREVNLLIS